MYLYELNPEMRTAIASAMTEIAYTVQDITDIYEDAFGIVVCIGNEEWYVFLRREDAEKAVSDYWYDMAENDPKEFACIIGKERLVQWALGESDSFNIDSLDNFCEVSGEYCEETLASYDSNEITVSGWYNNRQDDVSIYRRN